MFEAIIGAGGVIGKVLSPIIDKIFPDKEKAAQAKAEVELELIRMKQAGEFKQLETDLERDRMALADVASARVRESEMAKAGQRDYTPTILALALTAGFFGLLGLLIYANVDNEAMTLLQIMLGGLSTAFISIISYYFGSSSSSRKKDETIANIKKNL